MTTERIATIIKHSEGPTVLDLGAVQHDADMADSADWLHEHLVREFERVIGVDMLQKEVAKLNRQGYYMIDANVETMDFDIQADTVVAGELIEHLSNPGAMLDRAYEHLLPNGRLVLSTPNPWAIVHLRRLLTDSMQVNEEHTAWYGPIVLRQLLERHGFEDIHIEGVAPGRPWWSLTNALEKVGSDPFGYTTWVVVAHKA